MTYHRIGTNDNLVYNISNSKNMFYANVGYRHLCLCFSVNGGILSNSCPKSYIAKCLTFPLHYIWSDDRLRRTGVYSEGVLSAIYVLVHRRVVIVLLHH